MPVNDKALKIAYDVGRLVAERGYALVTGGLTGVMEQASKGARKAGGVVVGIVPSSDKEEANEYCDVVIPTGVGWARDRESVNSADGVILINGYIGTDIEARMAAAAEKPIVAIKSSGGVAEKLAGTIPYRNKGKIYSARTAEDAMKLLDELLSRVGA